MNLTDLAEVLRSRSESPGDTSHAARLSGIRSRVRAARLRQALTGAVSLLLVVAGVVYAGTRPADHSSEPAAPSYRFPDYEAGRRVIGQSWAAAPGTTVSVRFVPTSLDLALFRHCDAGPGRYLYTDVEVNGHPMSGGSCDSHNGGVTFVEQEKGWAGLGVVVGRPSIATMTVLGEQNPDPRQPPQSLLPVPDGAVFALALGEAVPVEDYPFPPRPGTLAELPAPSPDAAVVLGVDPAEPNGRRQVTRTWPDNGLVTVWTNTPGRLRVLIDDVEVLSYEHWSYEVGSRSWADHRRNEGDPDPEPGQRVTVTVIAERTSGDWRVDLG